jgi:hypothetical protein
MEKSHFTNGFEFDVPSTVQTVCYDGVTSAEIGQDFVLPDYQPEMRKILRVAPTVQPPTRFLGVGEAELAGNVCFDVLYVGGDGGLYSVALSAPYTFRVPMEGNDRMSGERALCLDAELTPQGMTHRLIAPRKLRLSCQLGAHVTLLGDCETDVRGAVEADQKLESSCLCARALCATGEALELTDEIPLDVGEGEVRVIGSEGTVRVVEARPTEEGVVCQGEVFLKILITREGVPAPEQEGTEEMHATEGEIETVNRRISFSQTVEMPQSVAREGWEASADGVCSDLAVRVENGRLLCAATVVCQAWAQGNERVTFIRDCYATDRLTECQMRSYLYARALGCINGNVTSGGNVDSGRSAIPGDAVPLDLSGCASLTGVFAERGRVVLTGDCLYRMLYRTAEGEIGHGEFHLPLKYELPDGVSADGTAPSADVRMRMLGGRARPDGEGGWTVDAEWSIAGRIYSREQIEAVDEVRATGGESVKADGTMVICYPSAEDTLWSVAKRYRASVRDVVARNELPGAMDVAASESLAGVAFLMME